MNPSAKGIMHYTLVVSSLLSKMHSIIAVIVFPGFGCSGITSVNISTLERRYQLSAWEVAWISGSYDIVAAVFSIIYGYLGTFAHNGKLLTMSAFTMALGSFIFLLPQMIAGEYELGQTVSDLCIPGGVCLLLNSARNYDVNKHGSILLSSVLLVDCYEH